MGPIKPIRRLYYQYGRLLVTPKLDAEEIFEALRIEGLVESAVQHQGRTTHYRETEQLRHLRRDIYLFSVQMALIHYASTHSLSPVRVNPIKEDT